MTQVGAPGAAVDFHAFHRDDLPARLAAGHGALAAADAARIGPLAIRTPAGAYTYVPAGDTVAVVAGDEAATTVVALDDESWQGLVADLETAPGLFYGGRVEVVRGDPLRFVRWEPALRAMFHGRPLHNPDAVALADRSGAPLDVTRRFTLDDLASRTVDAAHFLDTAGYVVVRDAFTADEVDAFLADAAQLRSEAREGDRTSWWGRDAAGVAVLCRVLRAASRPRLRALYDDDRVRAVAGLAAGLTDGGLVPALTDGVDGVTVLWKHPDVREGLADLPYHRDCGMGGHARNCPTFVMTICLTDGSAAAGELRVLPGSHTASFPFLDGTDGRAPAGVPLAVRAGDLSLHCSDLMHASLPPASADGPHRVSVLLSFKPPTAGHHRGERHYNDVLLGREDGQVEHPTALVGRDR